MTDEPMTPASSFGVFEDPYVNERKNKYKKLQEQALQGDKAALEILKTRLLLWERDGRRMI